MSQSDWRINPPLGVGLILFAGWCFAVLIGKPYVSQPTNPCTDQQQSHCLQNSQGTSVSGVAHKTPVPDPNPNRDEWREEQDLKAQQGMERWAFLLLIVTTAGVVYVAKTLKATRDALTLARETNAAAWKAVHVTQDIGEQQIKIAKRAAKDDREIGQAAQAAFLIVTDIRMEMKGERERVRITFKNIGPSTAYGFTVSSDARSGTFHDIRDTPALYRPSVWNNVIMPGDNDWLWVGAYRDRLFENAAPDQQYLFVGGALIWQDVFGGWRGIRFNQYARCALVGPVGKFHGAIAGNNILKRWQIKALQGTNFWKSRLRHKLSGRNPNYNEDD